MDTEPIFVKSDSLLDRAFVETPCPTTWDKMKGSDSVRFCHLCHLNVYNIANLTDKEAEAVLSKGKDGGRVCALLYRRPDGTIVTDNCPRALRKVRDASKWLKAKIIAATTLAMALLSPSAANSEETKAAKSKDTNQNSCTAPKTGNVVVKPVETRNGPSRPDIPLPGGISFRPSEQDQYAAKVFVSINAAGKKNGLVAPFPSVKFTVKADGSVENIAINQSSGNKKQDKAALKAVKEAAPFEKPPASITLPLKMEYRFTQERL